MTFSYQVLVYYIIIDFVLRLVTTIVDIVDIVVVPIAIDIHGIPDAIAGTSISMRSSLSTTRCPFLGAVYVLS